MLLSIKRISPQMGLWLALFFGCLLLQWLGWQSLLRFDRLAIKSGEWHRLFTANLVHLNWMHLWLNMGGLALVAFFFGRYLTFWRWLLLLGLTSPGVTLGMLWFNPGITYYVGLSGVLHGLFAAGALYELRRFPLSGWLLFLALVGKLVWEQLHGALPGSEAMIHGRVVVDSHLYGFITGLIVVSIMRGLPQALFKKLFR